MLEEIRFQFTRYLKKVYWELYEAGEVSEEAIKLLSNSCEIVNDMTSEHLNYFEILSSNFSMEAVRFYMYFKNISLIGSWVTRMLISKISFVYEVTVVMIEACE